MAAPQPVSAPLTSHPHTATTPAAPFVGVVAHQDGALFVRSSSGQILAIEHVADTVCPLQKGDRVLCLVDPALGAIITDRIIPASAATSHELFTELDSGQLLLDSPSGLVLQAGRSRMELHPDGTVLLDGKDIQSIADGINRMIGAKVELN